MTRRTRRLLLRGLPSAAVLLAVAVAVPAPPGWAQQVTPVPVPSSTEALPPPEALPGTASEPTVVKLNVGKTRLIELPLAVKEVIVADPTIADVMVKSPTKIYLLGLVPGSTNIFFLGDDNEIVSHMEVLVNIDVAAAQAAIDSLLPKARIEVGSSNETLVLKGTVRSARESADAMAIAASFAGEDAAVINMLRILEDMQVMLHVRISEIQRTVTKSLGINSSFSKTFGGRQLTANATNLLAGVTTNIAGSFVIDAFGLTNMTFNALESQGLAKTLAEPTLIAISGETASFLAGGEFPAVAGVDQLGNPVFELKEFGVKLEFTPTVLDNNQISLTIFTEITAISNANGAFITADVFQPGLTKRSTTTTVTLPSGGNVMIAGLLQNDESNTISGAPWVKDIPIIGALFRSTTFTNARTELVILLTAYLVQPVDGMAQLAMPTDGFVPASDFDFYVMGRLHKQYSKRKGAAEIPMLQGPFGYIME